MKCTLFICNLILCKNCNIPADFWHGNFRNSLFIFVKSLQIENYQKENVFLTIINHNVYQENKMSRFIPANIIFLKSQLFFKLSLFFGQPCILFLNIYIYIYIYIYYKYMRTIPGTYHWYGYDKIRVKNFELRPICRHICEGRNSNFEIWAMNTIIEPSGHRRLWFTRTVKRYNVTSELTMVPHIIGHRKSIYTNMRIRFCANHLILKKL